MNCYLIALLCHFSGQAWNHELNHEDLYIGPFLKHKPETKSYVEHRLRQLKKIMDVADEMKKQALFDEWNTLKTWLEDRVSKD